MGYLVKLYASKPNEIAGYLNKYFQTLDIPKAMDKPDLLEWQASYSNPWDLVDFVSYHQDQEDDFEVGLWICLDPSLYIQVTKENSDEIIRYIYERFPY